MPNKPLYLRYNEVNKEVKVCWKTVLKTILLAIVENGKYYTFDFIDWIMGRNYWRYQLADLFGTFIKLRCFSHQSGGWKR